MANGRMAKRHDVTSSFAACYYVTPGGLVGKTGLVVPSE